MSLVKLQMQRLARGNQPDPNASPLRALLQEQWKTLHRARQYRRHMSNRAG
ncbi:hypothetical protein D3C85_1445230 [compost metagenome]